jgi:hypothetical protein
MPGLLDIVFHRMVTSCVPKLTEDLQYQWVVKDQAAPDEAEAALNRISGMLSPTPNVTACHISCHSMSQ